MDKVLDFSKQVYLGRTIYRIYLNWLIKKYSVDLSGEFLDLAGGNNPSYLEYLGSGVDLKKTDYNSNHEVEQIIDFNQPLPFSDSSFDGVLMFNALYIAEDRQFTLTEIKRVLKDGGQLILSSPFIANEMPEPHDYCRLTAEGLEKELLIAGFNRVQIIRFGERFTSTAYLIHPLILFKTIRLLIYLPAIFLDKCLPKKIKSNYPTPLGYFCLATIVK